MVHVLLQHLLLQPLSLIPYVEPVARKPADVSGPALTVCRECKPGRVRNPTGGIAIGTAFANIITAILTCGQGLWVGPDSDGACNLGLDAGIINSSLSHREGLDHPKQASEREAVHAGKIYLTAATAAGAVASVSHPPQAGSSQLDSSQAQGPLSGSGWQGNPSTVVCGLTVAELAQQATAELLRLRAKVQTCIQAEKAAALQLTRARRALTTRQKTAAGRVGVTYAPGSGL
jgi:hypothetical protein